MIFKINTLVIIMETQLHIYLAVLHILRNALIGNFAIEQASECACIDLNVVCTHSLLLLSYKLVTCPCSVYSVNYSTI